jgi:hypothetical protein
MGLNLKAGLLVRGHRPALYHGATVCVMGDPQ